MPPDQGMPPARTGPCGCTCGKGTHGTPVSVQDRAGMALPLLTQSHGLVSQSAPSSMPAFSFSLLISPEKTFQITGSCCFQSPGEDRGGVSMSSCEIHIKV